MSVSSLLLDMGVCDVIWALLRTGMWSEDCFGCGQEA